MTDPHPDLARLHRIERGYRQLAAAIVLQAVRDAASPYGDIAEPARWWLAGDGLAYCLLLGLNLNAVHAWLAAGCPVLALDILTPSAQP